MEGCRIPAARPTAHAAYRSARVELRIRSMPWYSVHGSARVAIESPGAHSSHIESPGGPFKMVRGRQSRSSFSPLPLTARQCLYIFAYPNTLRAPFVPSIHSSFEAPMSADGPSSSAPFTPTGLEGHPEVVQKCTSLVQQFRDGKIGKGVAYARIVQYIPTAFVEGSAGERAAQSYVEILDQTEKDLAAAADRGGGSGPNPDGGNPDGGGRADSPPPNGGGAGGRGQGHSRSPSPHAQSGSKRRRVDDSKLPWVVNDFIIEATLPPELAKTRCMLAEFAPDPKYVLETILNSTSHPAFPESEWLAIIKGYAVDLNKVITHQFSVSHDRQHAESIGDSVQLLFGSSTPTKSVTSQSEWIAAWTKAAEATVFIFPHRRRELDSYRQYIMDLFTSSGEIVHPRIILLDRKLRNEVAGRRDLLLSDCRQFGHWERSFLNDNGAAYLESRPKAKDTTARGVGSSGGGGPLVATHTFALAASETIPSPSATDLLLFRNESEPLEPRAKRPRYLRSFIWSGSLDDNYSPTSLSTELDAPLPRPPLSEYTPAVMKTLQENQHLFKLITPINVDVFASFLVLHPNQPFVQSVVTGLREGFWPWADTQPGIYPETYDVSDCPLKTDEEREFVRAQRDIEIGLGRFSSSFGPDLLPGMYSMPIHAVPKPRSEKLRLVVNHKMGKFSLNSMIPREAIAGARLDTLKNLGDRILALRQAHGPGAQLVVWKSDVSQAYRRLPMHILWQIKQVVTIDGCRHIDRCNNFGNRGAGRIWTSFMGCVNWVANDLGIKSFVYIDDTYGADLADNMSYHLPYGDSFPTQQMQTLSLWDDISLNHERPKQLWGMQLTIIGFEVDPNAMTITMSESKRAELLAGVEEFCHVSAGGRRHSLHNFQQLAGWINWSLNVYQLLKPGLSHVYEKMEGKSQPDALIFVNSGVVKDLTWFAGHVRASSGILLLESRDWDPAEADVTAYCDASLGGLGIYFPASRLAFCVCWCLHEIARLVRANGKVVVQKITIWTDNSNTYDIFNTLRAKPLYNEILKSSVDILLGNNFKLRVLLLPGKKNVVADALSRWENSNAVSFVPELIIDASRELPTIPFTPPRDTLGDAKK
ncbi:hypothetical protein B0H13DRAFT_2488363 [Mycena leptocephala]|nr:hypothetical protein B0H13DRAFT_2488363 [Mycena leptocephala]